jgi:hypothetical protein
MSQMFEATLDFIIEDINHMMGHYSQPMDRSGSFSRANRRIRSTGTQAMGRRLFGGRKTVEGQISAFFSMFLI